MKKQFLTIDRNKCNDLATTLFLESAGINREGEKFERMREDAFHMRERIESRIIPRAVYLYFNRDEITLHHEKLSAGGQEFCCKAFGQLQTGSIDGLYLYACTAGDYSLPGEEVLNQVYADIWGTAFADAVRMLLKEELQTKSDLSDSFGPGFYGMSTREVTKIDSLLDFALLGIKLRNNTVMLPLKSCAGMYFAVNAHYKPLHRRCEFCYGAQSSCKLCHVLIANDVDIR